MPQFTRDGVTLNYEVDGDSQRPLIIFAHSLGASLAMWEMQAEALRDAYFVLRYDGRGHGKSSVPMTGSVIEDLAGDALALADHVGARRFCFCGLSLGGLVGQWLGLHASERLVRLVLCNTSARIGSAAGWSERIAVVESQGVEAIVEGGLQRWFTPRSFDRRPDIIDRFRAMILATPPKGYVSCCAALRDTDLRQELHRVSVPTMVVCGTHDPVTSVSEAEFMANAIAGARLLELDSAHLSNVEQADAFNRGVREFLSGR